MTGILRGLDNDINTQPCPMPLHQVNPVFPAKLQVLVSQVIQFIFLKSRDNRLYIMNRKSVYFLRHLHGFTGKQFYASNDISSGPALREYKFFLKALQVGVCLL